MKQTEEKASDELGRKAPLSSTSERTQGESALAAGQRAGEQLLLESEDASRLLILSRRLQLEGIEVRLFPPLVAPSLGGLGHQRRYKIWVPREQHTQADACLTKLLNGGWSEEDLETLAAGSEPPPSLRTPGMFQRRRFLALSFFLLIVVPFLVIYFSIPTSPP